MKRSNSIPDIPVPALARAVPDTATPSETAEHGAPAARKKAKPYLPADVLERTLVLTLEQEQCSGATRFKLQAPVMYAMNEEAGSFFPLPDDVLVQIVGRLESKARNALALACRAGYRSRDLPQSMRHLPGLLHDLKRLLVPTMKIRPDSLWAFMHAISPGGEYDQVLLTSLSQAERCAVSIAIAVWAVPRLHFKGKDELIVANSRFFEKVYDQGFTNGLEAIIDLQAGINETIDRSGILLWKHIFSNPKISRDITKITFEQLLRRTGADMESFSALIAISEDYTRELEMSTIALAALTNNNRNLPSLTELNRLPRAERNSAIFRIIDKTMQRPSSIKVNPDLYALALLSILNSITDSSEIDPTVISKMVVAFEDLLPTYYALKQLTLTFVTVRYCPDGSVAKDFDDLLFSDSGTMGANVGLFARLLIDKIIEAKAYLPAREFLARVVSAIRAHNRDCPRTVAYIKGNFAGRNQITPH